MSTHILINPHNTVSQKCEFCLYPLTQKDAYDVLLKKKTNGIFILLNFCKIVKQKLGVVGSGGKTRKENMCVCICWYNYVEMQVISVGLGEGYLKWELVYLF